MQPQIADKQLEQNCLKLIQAMRELHKQGYQNLAGLFYMSASGAYWRAELHHFNNLYIDNEGYVRLRQNILSSKIIYSSGQTGDIYFGWEDAKDCSALALAELIKSRLSELIESTKGVNVSYTDWFKYMLALAEEYAFPVFFREYYTPKPGYITTTSNRHERIIAPPHCLSE